MSTPLDRKRHRGAAKHKKPTLTEVTMDDHTGNAQRAVHARTMSRKQQEEEGCRQQEEGGTTNRRRAGTVDMRRGTQPT